MNEDQVDVVQAKTPQVDSNPLSLEGASGKILGRPSS